MKNIDTCLWTFFMNLTRKSHERAIIHKPGEAQWFKESNIHRKATRQTQKNVRKCKLVVDEPRNRSGNFS